MNNNQEKTINSEVAKTENKKNSKKGSKKAYIVTHEKKAEYLETYKNKKNAIIY